MEHDLGGIDPDPDHIHPANTDVVGESSKLIVFDAVYGVEGVHIRGAGTHFDKHPCAAVNTDRIDFAYGENEIPGRDGDPV